jgi:hypothetical protein
MDLDFLFIKDNFNIYYIHSTLTLEKVTAFGIPFICQSCSVTVLLKDHNVLTATGSQAGIGGSGWGNLTITSFSAASLFVQGGSNSPGIGSLHDDLRHSGQMSNSSITAIGGENASRIGNGNGDWTSSSAVRNSWISHSNISASGRVNGPGSGSRFSRGNRLNVSQIHMYNSSVTTTARSSAAGLGSGKADQQGLPFVGDLVISESIVYSLNNDSVSVDSGIAIGGKSSVGHLAVDNSFVSARGATGVGSGGFGQGGKSTVGEIVIKDRDLAAATHSERFLQLNN